MNSLKRGRQFGSLRPNVYVSISSFYHQYILILTKEKYHFNIKSISKQENKPLSMSEATYESFVEYTWKHGCQSELALWEGGGTQYPIQGRNRCGLRGEQDKKHIPISDVQRKAKLEVFKWGRVDPFQYQQGIF